MSDTPKARRLVCCDPPSGHISITAYGDAGPLCVIDYGPAEAVALAHDLLTAARARVGRAPGFWADAVAERVG